MRLISLIAILNLTGIALLVSCDSPRIHQKGDTNGNITPKKGDTNEPSATSESERPISVRLHPNSASKGPTKWPNEYCDPPTVTE